MYRHNPMSKDNLITCKIWKKTKKCRTDCPLRHSEYHELKQRKETMCYWEDKGGCTKYRCEYKHKDPVKDEWKEVKVKSLTEIKNLKNTIEIENEKKTEIDISNSEVIEDVKLVGEEASEQNVNEIVEPVLSKRGFTVEAIEIKRPRIETPKEFDDLDKELQELDDLLNEDD
jgi:ribosomal protein L15